MNEMTEWYKEYMAIERWQNELEDDKEQLANKIAELIAELTVECTKIFQKHVNENVTRGQIVVFLLDLVNDIIEIMRDSRFIGYACDVVFEKLRKKE